jgi:hypothetical protein
MKLRITKFYSAVVVSFTGTVNVNKVAVQYPNE